MGECEVAWRGVISGVGRRGVRGGEVVRRGERCPVVVVGGGRIGHGLVGGG